MRILITVLLIAFLPSLLLAQKDSTRSGSITGIVKDSADDYALQSVTITLYKKSDSSLVNYHITGEDGAFTFNDIPFFTPVNINFSFTGYNPFSKTITLDSANRSFNFKNVLLAKSQGTMDEVVVKAVVPITMNGDTLEINPAAFKLDSNAVVEDMLRRVPGVTMWGDGTITVNGRKVNNVYVDGKPFFGSDPAMATQNLPKNAIEKIQVYKETDYTKDNIDDNPADSMLTMNIKLREDKKFGYFGKAGAGIGTDDRYEGDASGLAYNKRIRGGIAASMNNINKSAGLQEMFQQSTYRNYNPNNRYVANFGSNGINRVLFLGGNVQYDFSQTNNSRFNNQLRANYDFRNTRNFTSSTTDSRITVPNRVYLQDALQESNSDNNSHNAGLSYNKRDQDKDFSVNLNFSSSDGERNSSGLTERFTEDGNPVSRSKSTTSSMNSSNGLNFSTSFRNKDDDDRNLKSFGLNYNLSLNDSKSESKNLTDFISYERPSENRYYNRKNNNEGSSFNTNLGMNYNALKRLLFGNFSLWNINMVLNNNVSFSRSESNTLVSDYDSLTANYIINDSLTNDNRVTRIEDRPSLRLSKNFTRRLSDRFNRYINVSANVQGQFLTERNESNFDYRNIDRSFNFFTPSASVGYNYQRFNKYTIEANLNGSSNPSIPTVDQLRPIVDTSTNVYNINLGNANLKPYITNGLTFNLNYRREQPARKADLSFELNGAASQVNRGIVDSSFFDDSTSRRTIYLINMDGRRNYSAGFTGRTSFKLKNNKVLQFNYSFNYSNTTSPNYVDGLYNIAKANNLTYNIGVFYTLGDIGNIQASQAINTNSSRQSRQDIASLHTVNYITQGNLNLSPIRDLTISSTINYVTNNTTNQSSTLWNAFATYRFLKTKQAEVKLSAMDILKKNQNIATTSSLTNVSTTVSNGLQQFFMVTLSYYPRKFGGGGRRGGGGRGEGGEGGGGERRNFERRGSGGGGFGGGGGGGMRGRN
ncbi:outer membrane beta-barrel protein [Niabella sp. CJ426]|uniref:outer membrane beta-barrel protein n=1 Tax=Niabella sp. CJ426 TaxID=3393740 RepID=UPI003CFE3DC8